MIRAGQLNRVRQVLIVVTAFVCGVVAGYFVWFVVMIALMASVSAYVGVVMPYAVAIVVVFGTLWFGVAQRKVLRPHEWVFVVSFALPSIVYSAALSSYLLFGRA